MKLLTQKKSSVDLLEDRLESLCISLDAQASTLVASASHHAEATRELNEQVRQAMASLLTEMRRDRRTRGLYRVAVVLLCE